MKRFVDWVLAQRLRLIIVSIVAAPLLPVVAAALIGLETARRGTSRGVLCGAGTTVGLVLLALVSRTDPVGFAAVGVACALSGVAIGGLIRQAGNLVLAFQAAVLACFGLVLMIGVLGIDLQPYFAAATAEFVALLPSETSPEEIALVQQRIVPVLLAAAVFSQVIGGLLLSYWWALVAAGQRRFGGEFRQLKLGRLLGAITTVLFVLGLVLDAPVVQNLTPLALLSFLLQGIAVLHAWAHVKRWHPALIVPLYLFLLMPVLNVLVVLPIGMLGLVDCWFDLRARWTNRSQS